MLLDRPDDLLLWLNTSNHDVTNIMLEHDTAAKS